MTAIADKIGCQELLLAAQSGDLFARERLAGWMLHTAKRQVSRALRTRYASVSGSSLLSQALVRLIRGNTIDLAPDIYYLIAAISRATRQSLIDHYRRVERRRRNAAVAAPKHLPWFQQILDEQRIDEQELETALGELERIHPRKASVVNLRFFCEMSVPEVSCALGISKSTVESDFRIARAWLFYRLGGMDA
jgi:RNA polymerase sigma-70 factor, ECF subfamily